MWVLWPWDGTYGRNSQIQGDFNTTSSESVKSIKNINLLLDQLLAQLHLLYLIQLDLPLLKLTWATDPREMQWSISHEYAKRKRDPVFMLSPLENIMTIRNGKYMKIFCQTSLQKPLLIIYLGYDSMNICDICCIAFFLSHYIPKIILNSCLVVPQLMF